MTFTGDYPADRLSIMERVVRVARETSFVCSRLEKALPAARVAIGREIVRMTWAIDETGYAVAKYSRCSNLCCRERERGPLRV